MTAGPDRRPAGRRRRRRPVARAAFGAARVPEQ